MPNYNQPFEPEEAAENCVIVRQSSSANPTVSVLMSVYNDARFIAESMESILSQEGPECEFVIVDDAGTDGSAKILDSCSDERITLIRHKANRGLAASLNDGLRYCRGKYIARMDGDDVSEPDRIRKEVEYLERHPGLGYVGCGIVIIDEEGKKGKTYLYPESPNEIRACFTNLESPLPHPTLMFRSEVLAAVHGYDEMFRLSEDYDLHLRLLNRCDAGSIQEPLVRLRVRRGSLQVSDSGAKVFLYVLFAQARQIAEQKYGPLNREASLALLSAIEVWFGRNKLDRIHSASIKRRSARLGFAQGRRLRALKELLEAIRKNPRWVGERIRHGKRTILIPSAQRQLDEVIDAVINALHREPS